LGLSRQRWDRIDDVRGIPPDKLNDVLEANIGLLRDRLGGMKPDMGGKYYLIQL
jgi:hypothetical protein